MFRQGQSDETLTTSGWTHLLEHMALEGRDVGSFDVNGSVDLLLTSFDVSGAPTDVTRHFAELTRWLAEPSMRRLHHSVNILKAERGQRALGSVASALVWRYGAQGPGLCGFDELGLTRVEPPDLMELAQRVFTRGNAVLVMDGEPPPGLTLSLPDGPLRPTVAPTPCDEVLPTNAAYSAVPGDLCLSGVLSRSGAATTVGRILTTQLKGLLRDSAGTSYSPWASYQVLDAEDALLCVGSDVDEERIVRQLGRIIDLLDTMYRHGPLDDELRFDRERALRQYADPQMLPANAWAMGRDALLGKSLSDVDELKDEVERMTKIEVREVAEGFRRSLMIGLPPRVHGYKQFVAWMTPPDPPQDRGTPVRSARHRRQGCRCRLVAHARGRAARHHAWRRLHGPRRHDGLPRWTTHVDRPGCLSARHRADPVKQGEQLVAEIDSRVPEAVRLPMPARQPEAIPRPRKKGWQRLVSPEEGAAASARLRWADLRPRSGCACCPCPWTRCRSPGPGRRRPYS